MGFCGEMVMRRTPEKGTGRWFYVFVVVLLMYGNYSVAIITRGVLA